MVYGTSTDLDLTDQPSVKQFFCARPKLVVLLPIIHNKLNLFMKT